jgi:transcriptional regulator with XRE-family HTH domain
VAGNLPPVPSPLPTDPALARALRRLREERGLAQEALAFASGVSTGTIARIETGQSSPAWTTVRALARGMGVTLVELGAAVEA